MIARIRESLTSGLYVHHLEKSEQNVTYCSKRYSSVARAFPGGRVAHPEGQNEEENEETLRKNTSN